MRRSAPVVLVMAANDEAAEQAVDSWREEGAVVLRARDWNGCLRVATSIGPDVLVLDQGAPKYIRTCLLAHPTSRSARIDWLAPGTGNYLDAKRLKGPATPAVAVA